MLRMPRMRNIFAPLILILERNKIFFITEFIYYKFSVIIIFFFVYWFFKTWLFLPILLFLLGQSRLLFWFSFFWPESRLMKVINEFTFTLNILAATALLSVEFSLKNFFAFFIPTVMMMKMGFILIRKRNLFCFEKKIANGLQMKLKIW
jgi:hypothetical protein